MDLFEEKQGERQAQRGMELGERLRRDVDLIVRRLHGKRVQLREKIEVSFVDREMEARTILEGAAGIRLLGGTVVLYGPWGVASQPWLRS